ELWDRTSSARDQRRSGSSYRGISVGGVSHSESVSERERERERERVCRAQGGSRHQSASQSAGAETGAKACVEADPHATMEEGYELDLTYITERIIAVSFPRACSEATYLHNLQDTMDMGWPDLHAPPLDKICTICKAMENWLNADTQHVVVIHCRGGKGRIGVIISSYVHFTNISASADQALDRFAMRKFYDDKVSTLMTPSQKRYVWILNSLLTGSMKMNASPLFLHYVILHGVPAFDTEGVCQPYLKVYQGMQAIKCYHKDVHMSTREVVFRLQFHTGTVHGCSLVFEKEDLENANKDTRFPDYGKVELVFSGSPEKIQGCERWQNGPDVTVDYNTADPLIRWDSYENSTDGAPTVTSSPDHSEHTLSTGSDSGHSSASLWTKRGPSRQERAELKRLLSGIGLEGSEPPMEAERKTPAGVRHVVPALVHVNGESRPRERETDILDDEVPAHDLHSVDSIGTLSSSEGQSSNAPGLGHFGYHKSSQNSLLSDGFCSHTGEEHHAPLPPDAGIGGSDDYERSFVDPKQGFHTTRGTHVIQTITPKPQVFSQGGYSTHTWVQQQQMVAAQQYTYLPGESESQGGSPKIGAVPVVPTRGSSSVEAVQRVGSAEPLTGSLCGDSDVTASREDELSALTVDIDQSIDQLNQLIMDLDPTFVPIPTRSNSVKKDSRSHLNGPTSVCTNGVGHRLLNSKEEVHPSMHQSVVGPAGDVRAGVDTPRSLSRKGSDVTDHPGLRTPGWGGPEKFQSSPLYSPSLPHSEHGVLYRTDTVGYRGQGEDLDCRVEAGSELVPPTPAFPVSPETPYVKSMVEFSHQMKLSTQACEQYEAYRTAHGMPHSSSAYFFTLIRKSSLNFTPRGF
ncbi:hypothetical protein JZ751_004114, partial [Albula glossodonta]